MALWVTGISQPNLLKVFQALLFIWGVWIGIILIQWSFDQTLKNSMKYILALTTLWFLLFFRREDASQGPKLINKRRGHMYIARMLFVLFISFLYCTLFIYYIEAIIKCTMTAHLFCTVEFKILWNTKTEILSLKWRVNFLLFPLMILNVHNPCVILL